MKTPFINTPKIVGLLILATLTLQACSLPIQPVEVDEPEIKQPVTANDSIVIESDDNATPADIEEPVMSEEKNTVAENSNGLTDTEISGLIYMREEEKLAHDVYLAMYDLWGLSIFQNIARSEETHTAAVKRLLGTFNLPDPADDTPPGIFTDPDLQKLYDELVALGALSLVDALKVGAAIEEIDIQDLIENLSFTDNSEIQRVYNNLLTGSENHLRAFTSTLERQTGETYQPQYLDEDAYQAILAQAPGRGGQNRKNRP